MEFLFAFLSFVAVCILWVRVNALQSDVKNLQQGHVSRENVSPQTTPTQPVVRTVAYTDGVQQVPHNTFPAQVHDDAGTRFIHWLAKDWLVKVGAFLLLIGLGWFVSYAFMHQWIGPVGRIALGLMTGAGILALGVWRIQTHVHQGGIFAVVGSTTILLTTFAARTVYVFFTPLSALVIMCLSVVLVACISVRYRSQALGLASIVLAGFAWNLAGNPSSVGALETFLYMLVVVLGTLWVVYLTGWANLTFAALALVAIEGIPFLMRGSFDFGAGGDNDIAFLFALIFTAVFFATNVASIVYRSTEKILKAHLFTALGTGLYIMMWIGGAALEEFQTLLYLAWALVFAFGTFVIYHKTALRAPFFMYGGIGLALLGAATASEFEGIALTIAFTIEIAVVVAASARIPFAPTDSSLTSKKPPVVTVLAWLFALPIALSFPSMASYEWSYGLPYDHFFVLVILMLSLAGVSGYISFSARPYIEMIKKTGLTLLTISGLYALLLVWLVLHAEMPDDVATSMALFIYTVVGLVFYVSGHMASQSVRRIAGALLLGGVIVRLLIIDVWEMPLTGRIVTFIGVGVLLMSTAFIKRIKK